VLELASRPLLTSRFAGAQMRALLRDGKKLVKLYILIAFLIACTSLVFVVGEFATGHAFNALCALLNFTLIAITLFFAANMIGRADFMRAVFLEVGRHTLRFVRF
jgi:hypothetical protein